MASAGRRRIPPGVVVAAALVAIAYALYGILRHAHFRTSGFDLGIFDQIVWHYSRFRLPPSTLAGFDNAFADHFSPILALLAPAYWVAPRPEVLLVAQGVLVGLSVVPVYWFCRRRFSSGPALTLAIAYGLSWPIQRGATFDFHALAFAPLFVALAIDAVDDDRPGQFWVAACGLALTKEDLTPLIMVFGLWLLARRRLAQGTAAVAAGLAAFALIVGWLMPALGDSGQYTYDAAYGRYGGPVQAVLGVFRDPIGWTGALLSPPAKLATLGWLLAPWLLLPLGSPLVLLGTPLLLERFLSDSPNHWSTAFHYWLPAGPILAAAAADGLLRARARFGWLAGRALPVTVAVVLVACAIAPGRPRLWQIVTPRFYTFSAFERAGHRVVALVPPGASVVAQDAIAPHLSQRDRIYTLRPEAPDADFVVAAPALNPWPNADRQAVDALVDERRRAGYTVWHEEDGWIVLRAPAR